MRYLCSLILAMLIVSPVWAEDEIYSQCMQQAETNYEIRQCNADRLEILDAELNRVWRELYPALPPGRAKTALLNEQRKWIDFKDSSCIFWHYGFGTAGRDMFFYSCRENIIEQRIKYLSQLNNDINQSTDFLLSDAPFILCKEAQPGLRFSINCKEAFDYLKKNDAELNQVWREIRNQWKDDEYYHQAWETLLDEQRKWVAFKENAFQYYKDESFTTGWLGDLTKQRTEELKEILANPEED